MIFFKTFNHEESFSTRYFCNCGQKVVFFKNTIFISQRVCERKQKEVELDTRAVYKYNQK